MASFLERNAIRVAESTSGAASSLSRRTLFRRAVVGLSAVAGVGVTKDALAATDRAKGSTVRCRSQPNLSASITTSFYCNNYFSYVGTTTGSSATNVCTGHQTSQWRTHVISYSPLKACYVSRAYLESYVGNISCC